MKRTAGLFDGPLVVSAKFCHRNILILEIKDSKKLTVFKHAKLVAEIIIITIAISYTI
ncbi:hypothetical protein [Spiroplasma endosymbiont of Polydrusus formosus]|uniref:hypothetical protein n=1 Tax=Spiroplasma endosymbiont of Polydrusus formosus TaxID=3139326 RepID=UPI0035B5315F